MFQPITALVTISCLLQPISARRIVDLTHTLDGNATRYPLTALGVINATYYKMDVWLAQYYPGDLWVQLGKVEFYEHLGTHIDAPIHLGGPGRQEVHEIPPEKLMGPGVVIDIRDKAKANPDYAVTVQDLKDYEREYGRIPMGAIVMMNSGWAEKYPHSQRVFGSEDLGNSSTFHFPGYSLDACKMLLNERQVSILGVDTPSTDPAQPGPYYCHMYLQPNEVPLLEYVANLDSIPRNGTTIFVGAIKTRGGSGGPTRVFAVIDEEKGEKDVSSAVAVLGKPTVLTLVGIIQRVLVRAA